MIEVFKTNVEHEEQACVVLQDIHATFMNYQASFDLTDCDRILRIKCENGLIEPTAIIEFLKKAGYCAEVL